VNNMARLLAQGESGKLATEIERLAALSREQLDERWRELFGSERPRRLYGALLVGVLAYRLQERTLGGLKPATRHLLRQVAGHPTARGSIAASLAKPRLTAGTVLLRQWHGTTHRVAVLEHGFEHGGQRFNSLSAIARRITGSRWSGPLFFGLKAMAQGQTNASE
jgi:hypothetical protein